LVNPDGGHVGEEGQCATAPKGAKSLIIGDLSPETRRQISAAVTDRRRKAWPSYPDRGGAG
jgi:hypothetical protein